MKHILCFLAIISTSQVCISQIKIGDITVSDSIGNKFLKWCYSHPDTVSSRGEHAYIGCYNCTVSDATINWARQQALDWNESHRKSAIKIIDCKCVFGNIVPGEGESYLIPKNPTALLFIKWLHKQ